MKLFFILFAMLYAQLSNATTLKIMPLGDSLTAGGYIVNGTYRTDQVTEKRFGIFCRPHAKKFTS